MRFFRRRKALPSPFRLRQRVRRRDRWVFAAAVLLAAALYFYRVPARRKSGEVRPDPGSETFSLVVTSSGAFCPEPHRLSPAAVLDTVDGDTLRVQWEGREMSLRYYGVDTPERGEPCYEEATRRNRALAGEAVGLLFDERTRDPGGRLLAYVFTGDGRSLDAALIREGLGRAWRRDGRYRDFMGRLEDEARAVRAGCLWKEKE